MADNAPKTLTIKLEEPVEHGGKTYTELTFRRLKGRDLLMMDKVRGELAKTFAMMASMAGVPMQVFEEMEAEDFARITQETIPLMGKSARRAMESAPQEATREASPE